VVPNAGTGVSGITGKPPCPAAASVSGSGRPSYFFLMLWSPRHANESDSIAARQGGFHCGGNDVGSGLLCPDVSITAADQTATELYRLAERRATFR